MNASRLRGRRVEDDALAGDAAFGLLKLRHIDGANLKASPFKHRYRLRKGARHNHRFANQQSVGGSRLARRHIDKIESRKRSDIYPTAIDEQSVMPNKSAGALEMQAAGDFDRLHCIPERREMPAELSDALAIRAA